VTEALPFSDLACSFLAPINSIPGIRAGWVPRIPYLEIRETAVDRSEAMRVLRPHHERAVQAFGSLRDRWWRAEQIHGTGVASVPDAAQIQADDALPHVPAVDGLITAATGTLLTIYVADCAAIWLADRRSGAIGLLHSGKKGTDGNILGVALRKMGMEFGTRPEDVTAVLSPCIRPPQYEIDFAAEIARQAAAAGVGAFHDCGENTACDLARHYSYRMELGKTGRMMAMIARELP